MGAKSPAVITNMKAWTGFSLLMRSACLNFQSAVRSLTMSMETSDTSEQRSPLLDARQLQPTSLQHLADREISELILRLENGCKNLCSEMQDINFLCCCRYPGGMHG